MVVVRDVTARRRAERQILEQAAAMGSVFWSGAFVSLARLHVTPAGPTWAVEQIRLNPDDPADEKLADTQLKALFRRKLAEFTKTLDEREEDILRNRILSETPLTLEDMGAKYGITKERTRQLEARIIKRLRDFIKKDVKDFDRLRM